MKWPLGVSVREPPSKRLFTLFRLDDIKTIGLPACHPRPNLTQLVAMPEFLARSHTRTTGGLYQYAPAIPRDCFWSPFQKGILVSLTGDAQTIGPVWKQMKGVEAEVPFDQSLKLSSQSWTEHVQNFSIANAASEEFRSHLETRNNMRVKLALQLGKKLKDLV